MKISKMSCLMIVYITLFCANITPMVYAECQGDLNALSQQCYKYVEISGPKENPSQECCKVVQGLDVPCMCLRFSKVFGRFFSLEKAVFVLRFCGKSLAPGTKCGDYIIPPRQGR
ncbi:hypothetical protein ACP275_04G066700 [Erythranthe tilingii]